MDYALCGVMGIWWIMRFAVLWEFGGLCALRCYENLVDYAPGGANPRYLLRIKRIRYLRDTIAMTTRTAKVVLNANEANQRL